MEQLYMTPYLVNPGIEDIYVYFNMYHTDGLKDKAVNWKSARSIKMFLPVLSPCYSSSTLQGLSGYRDKFQIPCLLII